MSSAISGSLAVVSVFLAGGTVLSTGKKYLDNVFQLSKHSPQALAASFLMGSWYMAVTLSSIVTSFDPSSDNTTGSPELLPVLMRASFGYAAVTMFFGPFLILTPTTKIILEKESLFKKIVKGAQSKKTRTKFFYLFCFLTAMQGFVVYSLYETLWNQLGLGATQPTVVIGIVVAYFLICLLFLVIFYSVMMKKDVILGGVNLMEQIRRNVVIPASLVKRIKGSKSSGSESDNSDEAESDNAEKEKDFDILGHKHYTKLYLFLFAVAVGCVLALVIDTFVKDTAQFSLYSEIQQALIIAFFLVNILAVVTLIVFILNIAFNPVDLSTEVVIGGIVVNIKHIKYTAVHDRLSRVLLSEYGNILDPNIEPIIAWIRDYIATANNDPGFAYIQSVEPWGRLFQMNDQMCIYILFTGAEYHRDLAFYYLSLVNEYCSSVYYPNFPNLSRNESSFSACRGIWTQSMSSFLSTLTGVFSDNEKFPDLYKAFEEYYHIWGHLSEMYSSSILADCDRSAATSRTEFFRYYSNAMSAPIWRDGSQDMISSSRASDSDFIVQIVSQKTRFQSRTTSYDPTIEDSYRMSPSYSQAVSKSRKKKKGGFSFGGGSKSGRGRKHHKRPKNEVKKKKKKKMKRSKSEILPESAEEDEGEVVGGEEQAAPSLSDTLATPDILEGDGDVDMQESLLPSDHMEMEMEPMPSKSELPPQGKILAQEEDIKPRKPKPLPSEKFAPVSRKRLVSKDLIADEKPKSRRRRRASVDDQKKKGKKKLKEKPRLSKRVLYSSDDEDEELSEEFDESSSSGDELSDEFDESSSSSEADEFDIPTSVQQISPKSQVELLDQIGQSTTHVKMILESKTRSDHVSTITPGTMSVVPQPVPRDYILSKACPQLPSNLVPISPTSNNKPTTSSNKYELRFSSPRACLISPVPFVLQSDHNHTQDNIERHRSTGYLLWETRIDSCLNNSSLFIGFSSTPESTTSENTNILVDPQTILSNKMWGVFTTKFNNPSQVVVVKQSKTEKPTFTPDLPSDANSIVRHVAQFPWADIQSVGCTVTFLISNVSISLAINGKYCFTIPIQSILVGLGYPQSLGLIPFIGLSTTRNQSDHTVHLQSTFSSSVNPSFTCGLAPFGYLSKPLGFSGLKHPWNITPKSPKPDGSISFSDQAFKSFEPTLRYIRLISTFSNTEENFYDNVRGQRYYLKFQGIKALSGLSTYMEAVLQHTTNGLPSALFSRSDKTPVGIALSTVYNGCGNYPKRSVASFELSKDLYSSVASLNQDLGYSCALPTSHPTSLLARLMARDAIRAVAAKIYGLGRRAHVHLISSKHIKFDSIWDSYEENIRSLKQANVHTLFNLPVYFPVDPCFSFSGEHSSSFTWSNTDPDMLLFYGIAPHFVSMSMIYLSVLDAIVSSATSIEAKQSIEAIQMSSNHVSPSVTDSLGSVLHKNTSLKLGVIDLVKRMNHVLSNVSNADIYTDINDSEIIYHRETIIGNLRSAMGLVSFTSTLAKRVLEIYESL